MTNSFGKLFAVTVFGESHGRCVGAVIDGCPAGLPFNEADIQPELDRRRAGASAASTSRVEEDKVEILSGVFNGFTTGAPLMMIIWNKDVAPADYEKNRFLPRPGHADYSAFIKYGGFNDYRGGGMFSGRLTASFVMAGTVAKKLLSRLGIEVLAHTVAIGGIAAEPLAFEKIKENAEQDSLRCADADASKKMMRLIEQVKKEGDSVGGIIEGIARNVPAGLGEPPFDTLDGELAKALLAIPAVKGVEFGNGFSTARRKGSENNDPFTVKDGKIFMLSNNAGGILGGISSGMSVVVRAVVKPTASIAIDQTTVDLQKMTGATLGVRGRHDVCIVPRAVPVVEAMMAVTICDFAQRAGLVPGVIK
ncbi:MAG: chorismate synthase [Dehalococcoidales bacterium]|nr:chorismate synthase [Dehalococcoidales bacterium]